jgi:hypothetical protein
MWLTAPPPPDESQGHWCQNQVEGFAAMMQGYGHDE